MSSSVGARRVTTPSVRVGMVLYAGGMRLIVLGRSTRFPPATSPSPERRTPAGTMTIMSEQTPAEKPALPRVLSGIQPTSDSFHFGNYLGATAAVGRPAGRRTSRSSSSPTCTPWTVARTRRSCASARTSRRPADRDGHRPGALGDLRAVAHARARRARLGAAVPDRLRRGAPDDAVQGQVRQGRRGRRLGRAVHLPDPAGGRHPALPAGVRPRRGGPAPAPRADPRPRAAVQPPLQEDLPAAGALHPEVRPRRSSTCRTPRSRCRSPTPASAASSRCSTTPRSRRRRSAPRSPTPGPRSASTPRRSPASPTCSRSTPRSPAGTIDDLVDVVRRPGYGAFKGDLADVVVEFVTPFRDRTLELLDDRAELDARARGRGADGRRGGHGERSPTSTTASGSWPVTTRSTGSRHRA